MVESLIEAGAIVGGAYLIGAGLGDSGDTINSGSSSGSSARQVQQQGQIQLQGQATKVR